MHKLASRPWRQQGFRARTQPILLRHTRKMPLRLWTPHWRRTGDRNADGLQQVGRLWTAMADYFIRQGMFEKARDVYEEGLTTVITVRDFSLIFDALTTFETSLLEARLAVRSSVCGSSIVMTHHTAAVCATRLTNHS